MHEHRFVISTQYPDYEICVDCGSYHSLKQVPPKTLYEDEDYWSHEHGHSTPEEQIYNLTETETSDISKVESVLRLVPIEAKNILEIGCCPGELLRILSEEGCNVIGVEPATRHIGFIRDHAPEATVIAGFFPEVFPEKSAELFDCIIFMDVFEHIEKTDEFINAVHRLLVKGGTAICMSPVILEDGRFRERDFAASEHCWIYTHKFLKPYLENIFSAVSWGRWQIGHEQIIMIK